MKSVKAILDTAKSNGQGRLSEFESKQILSTYGIPVVQESLTADKEETVTAAADIGFPVVLKGCSADIAHKTEEGLIALDIRDEADLLAAFDRMAEKSAGKGMDYLVQNMIRGSRELVMGLVRDHQFGPCVMFGLGGIYTEALADVTFRAAPLTASDAMDMMHDIKGYNMLSAIRGMPAVDLDQLSQCLIGLGQVGLDHDIIREIDINPLIVKESRPVAVDALIVLEQ